ncbi:MAG: 1-deoxy-D-xylulose 5-phosphate synthase [Candidatus Rifleibacterium amylolyticum]|nr:MAG: 1-deoxy-D-xylulose 5-phosphate synthase [Candidatus Rifleibacterium amylolyticum]NLF95184.1 1-deoxy-D-xylulose-5-phosphate synthase [Candidatus Riflebacteria bacterium]
MILDRIREPADLEFLSYDELQQLSSEIREMIINVVSRNGGHLASNLGIVELTLAVHRIFRSPKDQIVWDVGHQCYTHKIVTGRREQFAGIRTFGGISGFPKICESRHDMFNTGHSSTSISAAQGLAIANQQFRRDGKVVAVIGDGALTAGMAFEALNYTGHEKNDVVVILNDNEMSISPNVGAMSMYLHRLRLEPAYTTPKDYLAHVLKQIPGFGSRLYNVISRLEGSLKYLLTPGMLFEEFGFKYFGPVDGYDFETLERALIRARDRKGPVLVHVLTEKGRGYKPAQEFCHKFHGTGPFEISTGKAKSSSKTPPSYTDVFGNVICRLAAQNEDIVAITAAMKEGTGLNRFALDFPARFFDVGIAEQHAITMAAGMAKGGLRPFVAIYSSFMQRAYDQVIHDVSLMKLPVVMCLDRAGLVGEDGPTHHGVFDVSFLRCVPDIQVMAPRDEIELDQMLTYAAEQNGPVAIRYPRGAGIGCEDSVNDRQPIVSGRAEIVREGKDIVIWALGHMLHPALEAAKELEQQGINACVINPRFIKPFDLDMLTSVVNRHIPMITVEENALPGGFGSLIAEHAIEMGHKAGMLRIGIPDGFVQHGSQSELRRLLKIDAAGIKERIAEWLQPSVIKKVAC